MAAPPRSVIKSKITARGRTAVDGAMALIVVLLIAQVWLLSATLNSLLSGHPESAIPGAIASGLMFAACAGLYRLVVKLERRARSESDQ